MPPTGDNPNVLVVFTDQQRWDTAGCYGGPMELTPNLDAMARRGVRFQNAFTCQPVCGPARASIQTGLYAEATGVFRNGIALRAGQRTIAHHFTEAGYDVGYIGKWHLGGTGTEPVPRQARCGYDGLWEASDVLEFTSHPYEGRVFDAGDKPIEFRDRYRVDFLTDRATSFIEAKRERPFYLYLSYIEPHQQNDWGRVCAPEGYAERFANPWVPPDLRDKPGDWQQQLPDYYGCIARIDECLGRLMECLEATGQADNTLVVFTSDHGCHFRTRNGEYKRSCHESCIRIPMVFAGPRFGGGRVVHDLVSLIDLAPTLLTAAGLEAPDEFHGRSMLPLAEGEPTDWPEEVFMQISEATVERAIRTRRWKYSVFDPTAHGGKDPSSNTYVERYLYDLQADPYESVNLIGRRGIYRDAADELMQRLKRRMTEAGEPAPEIRPARHYA